MPVNTVPVMDVAVIGGGPAGCSAARLLADWGHRVVLLTRPAPTPSLAETIPPSASKLLEHLDWRETVDGAGFIRSTGNTVLWNSAGGAGMRQEPYPDAALGYQVDRELLNRVMLAAVRERPATVVDDATVTGVAGGLLKYVASDGNGAVVARWVLDCSGRSGVIARHGWRRPLTQLRTLAIAGVWERADGWPLVDPSHTVVVSHLDGWAWSIPLSETRRQITVMVDPRLTSPTAQSGLTAAYEAELERIPALWGDTRQAAFCGEAFARDASPYRAYRVGRPGILLVGDAASFADPLSSYGIKKALASAWLASVVAHTALTEEAMAPAALALYESREKAMYDALERQRQALAQLALGGTARSDFWSSRADPVPGTGDVPNEDLDVEALRRDPAVQAAFDELKRRSSITLTPSPAVGRVEQPTVRGNRVVLQRRLRVPEVPVDLRYVRDVDLVPLVDLAPGVSQVPDLYDVYCREVAPVPLGDFLGALSLLVAKRVLVFA